MLSEHHITVSRTARYVVLGSADGALRELWIACHGYGNRAARFARSFETIAGESRRIVVPEALSRFYLDAHDAAAHREARVGASWMTREDRQAEINDYVEYLNALWRQVGGEDDSARLTVLGFSQGAATAARWSVFGAARPARLVLWGGSMPRDILNGATLEKLRTLELVLVAGSEDPYATEDAVTHEIGALEAHGLAPRTLRFQGGHHLDAATLSELATAGYT
jgi:predicted esterase